MEGNGSVKRGEGWRREKEFVGWRESEREVGREKVEGLQHLAYGVLVDWEPASLEMGLGKKDFSFCQNIHCHAFDFPSSLSLQPF